MRARAESLPLKAIGTARDPIPVSAWVSRPQQGVVQLEAIAWIPSAVRVQLVHEHGPTEQVWVWANAIVRRTPTTRA